MFFSRKLLNLEMHGFAADTLFKFYNHLTFESSRPEVFCKEDVFKNFVKLTGKHPYQSLFIIKLQSLGLQLYLKRGSGTSVFL